MKELLLLLDRRFSGVYSLDGDMTPADIEAEVKRAELLYLHIDGSVLKSKEHFLQAAAQALHFPESFGYNWDAFEDSLTDLSWLDAAGFVLVYDHTEVFMEQAPADFQTALDIFHAAVEFWREEEKPLLILLGGKQPVSGAEQLVE